MKHLGILAHSSEGAALCFQTFCREGFTRLGAHQHPDVSLDCIAMARAMAAWDAGDYASIGAIFRRSLERLHKAGCDFFVCPDNTAHIALEQTPDLPLPGLHIAEVVADAAAGMKKVGVLGTRYTMDGPVYRRALSARAIEFCIPEPDRRAEINRIIFEELVEGRFRTASRDFYLDTILKLKSQGCDGVALVCTEIPLLITPEVSPLPVLDSTRLLARAAFEVAMGKIPLPQWRGGPP
ncbi:MAG: amino acid racemase [Vulcanimicrobiota bacterium]